MELRRNPTRAVRIGTVTIGAGQPIAVQSMTATHTQDIDATVAQMNALHDAGADVVRVAVDSKKDVEALAEIRRSTQANLAVDLQENYRLAELVAPHVDKIRYNPGHLYHHERDKPWQDKVKYRRPREGTRHRPARGRQLRLGRPRQESQFDPEDDHLPCSSALEHCALLDDLGFTRYCVSLKDSDRRR